MRLSDTQDLLGVFSLSATELDLEGVVSPASGVTQTETTETPPVATLKFPLQMGASWSTTSTVTGTLNGVFSTWQESYQDDVDAHGTLDTPFGTFDVLRVKVVLTRTVGIVPTVVRTFAFVTECFGTVATITVATTRPRPSSPTRPRSGGSRRDARPPRAHVAVGALVPRALPVRRVSLLPHGRHAGRAPRRALRRARGVRVRYLDEGQGPPVVLIHGFASSLDTWRTVLPVLTRHHRVIALDLKGFGWTDRPAGDYSPEAQARSCSRSWTGSAWRRRGGRPLAGARRWRSTLALLAPERV